MYVEEVVEGASYVEHTILGTLEEVLGRVSSLFGEYHPMGYSTVVKRIGTPMYRKGVAPTAPYEAVVWRSSSCE